MSTIKIQQVIIQQPYGRYLVDIFEDKKFYVVESNKTNVVLQRLEILGEIEKKTILTTIELLERDLNFGFSELTSQIKFKTLTFKNKCITKK